MPCWQFFRGAALGSIIWLVLTPCLLNAAPQETSAPSPRKIDVQELMNETQRIVRGKSATGMVWWIPVEFWEATSRANPETTKAMTDSLRPYVLIAVVVGNMGALGTVTWLSGDEIRAKARFRATSGTEFAPLTEISGEAKVIQGILRPVMSNLVGKMGESVEWLFFPAKDKDGNPLLDPRGQGTASLILRDIAQNGDLVYEWQPPLTSLSPPRFCPSGGEPLKANWKFCPWHGTPLGKNETDAAKHDKN